MQKLIFNCVSCIEMFIQNFPNADVVPRVRFLHWNVYVICFLMQKLRFNCVSCIEMFIQNFPHADVVPRECFLHWDVYVICFLVQKLIYNCVSCIEMFIQIFPPFRSCSARLFSAFRCLCSLFTHAETDIQLFFLHWDVYSTFPQADVVLRVCILHLVYSCRNWYPIVFPALRCLFNFSSSRCCSARMYSAFRCLFNLSLMQ